MAPYVPIFVVAVLAGITPIAIRAIGLATLRRLSPGRLSPAVATILSALLFASLGALMALAYWFTIPPPQLAASPDLLLTTQPKWLFWVAIIPALAPVLLLASARGGPGSNAPTAVFVLLGIASSFAFLMAGASYAVVTNTHLLSLSFFGDAGPHARRLTCITEVVQVGRIRADAGRLKGQIRGKNEVILVFREGSQWSTFFMEGLVSQELRSQFGAQLLKTLPKNHRSIDELPTSQLVTTTTRGQDGCGP